MVGENIVCEKCGYLKYSKAKGRKVLCECDWKKADKIGKRIIINEQGCLAYEEKEDGL